MAKQKKNSNYVTEKNLAKKESQQKAALAAKKRKNLINAILAASITIAIIGGILGMGFGFGWFDYSPEATGHAVIAIKDYGTLHVELYGNDAPLTVAHLTKLMNAGKYNYTKFYKYEDGLLYGGDQYDNLTTDTVKGEFSENGVKNKISLRRGTIAMSRENAGYDSATSQFFIVTDNATELNGSYAAFARIDEDGMEVIDRICKDIEAGKEAPVITSISLHEAHH